jgi:hypothetical protein
MKKSMLHNVRSALDAKSKEEGRHETKALEASKSYFWSFAGMYQEAGWFNVSSNYWGEEVKTTMADSPGECYAKCQEFNGEIHWLNEG